MSPLTLRRLALSVLLLAYVFYAFRLAPPDDPPGAAFSDLARGHGLARNPAIFAVFNGLGVLPLMYWALLFPDGRGQKLWAGPFALGMMALGSFSLLPYLILRHSYTAPVAKAPGPLVRWFGGRPFALFADAALLALLAWGVTCGDWADYAHWFRTSNLVNVMSVDFGLLVLLFPILLHDDFARRGLTGKTPLARLALAVPLLGPAAYLALRPPEATEPVSA